MDGNSGRSVKKSTHTRRACDKCRNAKQKCIIDILDSKKPCGRCRVYNMTCRSVRIDKRCTLDTENISRDVLQLQEECARRTNVSVVSVQKEWTEDRLRLLSKDFVDDLNKYISELEKTIDAADKPSTPSSPNANALHLDGMDNTVITSSLLVPPTSASTDDEPLDAPISWDTNVAHDPGAISLHGATTQVYISSTPQSDIADLLLSNHSISSDSLYLAHDAIFGEVDRMLFDAHSSHFTDTILISKYSPEPPFSGDPTSVDDCVSSSRYDEFPF